MRIFIDTSAIYALGSLSDQDHALAKQSLKELIEQDNEFVTSNYVLLECISLLQRRKGLNLTRRFIEKIYDNIAVLWISEAQHKRAWDYWKRIWKRELSLVDCSSFILMQEEGIKEAFAFDRQFAEAGFKLV